MVKMLKNIFKSLNLKQKLLNRALIFAVENNYVEEIKNLVSKGADINANNGYSLVLSAFSDDWEMVRFLIDNGANVDSQDNYALIAAVESNDLEIIKYLVGKGANIHAQNNNALRLAAHHEDLEILKYFLLEHNVNIQFFLEEAQKHKIDKIIHWCENYIESKKLNDSLELSLKNNKDTGNKKEKI